MSDQRKKIPSPDEFREIVKGAGLPTSTPTTKSKSSNGLPSPMKLANEILNPTVPPETIPDIKIAQPTLPLPYRRDPVRLAKEILTPREVNPDDTGDTGLEPNPKVDEPVIYEQYKQPVSKLVDAPSERANAKSQAMYPITTTGELSSPAAVGQFLMLSEERRNQILADLPKGSAKKDLLSKAQTEYTRQMLLPPEKRSGVSGVVASLFPEIKAQTDEGTGKRFITESVLPYTFRLLNIPSALIGTSLEQAADVAGIGTTDSDKGFVDRLLDSPSNYTKNLARQLGKGEGVWDAGEKSGALIDKTLGEGTVRTIAGVSTLGGSELVRALGKGASARIESVLPESITSSPIVQKHLTDAANIKPGFKQLGSSVGLLTELATPSTIEAIAGPLTIGTKAITSATPPPKTGGARIPTPGTPKTGYQRSASNVREMPPRDPNEIDLEVDNFIESHEDLVKADMYEADIERISTNNIQGQYPIYGDRYIGPVHGDHPAFAKDVAQPIDGNTAVWKYHDIPKKAYSESKEIIEKKMNGEKLSSVEEVQLKLSIELQNIIKNADKWKDIDILPPEQVKEIHILMNKADEIIRTLSAINPSRWTGWQAPYTRLDINPTSVELDKFGRPTDKAVQDLVAKLQPKLEASRLKHADARTQLEIEANILRADLSNKHALFLTENPKFQKHYRGTADDTPTPIGKTLLVRSKPGESVQDTVITAEEDILNFFKAEKDARRNPADIKYIAIVNNINPSLVTGKYNASQPASQGVLFRIENDKLVPDRVVSQSPKNKPAIERKVEIVEQLDDITKQEQALANTDLGALAMDLKRKEASINSLIKRRESLPQDKHALIDSEVARLQSEATELRDTIKQVSADTLNELTNEKAKLTAELEQLSKSIASEEQTVARRTSELYKDSGVSTERLDIALTERDLLLQTKRINNIVGDISGRDFDIGDFVSKHSQAVKDSLGYPGTPPLKSPATNKQLLRDLADEYLRRLNGLSDRWKFFARKYESRPAKNKQIPLANRLPIDWASKEYLETIQPSMWTSLDDGFAELITNEASMKEELVNHLANILARKSDVDTQKKVSIVLTPDGNTTPRALAKTQHYVADLIKEHLMEIDLTNMSPLQAINKLLRETDLFLKGQMIVDGQRAFNPNSPIELKGSLSAKQLLPELYAEAYIENSARLMESKLVDYGYSSLTKQSQDALGIAPTSTSQIPYEPKQQVTKLNAPVIPDELFRIVKETISPKKADGGYHDFLKQIADIHWQRDTSIADSLKEYRDMAMSPDSPYHTVYLDYIHGKIDTWIDNGAGFEMISNMRAGIDSLSLASSLQDLVGSKTARDRLASLFASDPKLSRLVQHLPDAVRERGSRHFVDQFFKLVTSEIPEEVTTGLQIARWLEGNVSTTANVMKTGILYGTLAPNPAYHMVNLITAPLIMYQNLGMKSTLGSMAEFPNAARLTQYIYGQTDSLLPTVKVITPTKLYDANDLIKLYQENGLGYSATNFELQKALKDDMNGYIDIKDFDLYSTTRAQRRSPITATGLNKEGIKNILGMQGANFWGEMASSMDNTFKMSVLMDSLRAGDNEATAIKKAREALFDYSKMTDFERAAFRNLLWFQAFWRNNIVSTIRNLMSPKGSTRIKNLLLLNRDRPEAENDYSDTKPYLGKTITGNYDIYGPGIPAAEATKFILEQLGVLFKILPSPSYNMNEAMDIEADFIANKLGSNKILNVLSQLILGFDISNRRPVTNKLDTNYENLFKVTGLIDGSKKYNPSGIAVYLFDLRFNQDENTYEFRSNAGRNKFIAFRTALGDILAGRWPGIVGGTIESRNKSIEQGRPVNTGSLIQQGLIRTSGAGSVYPTKNLREIFERRNTDLQYRINQ